MSRSGGVYQLPLAPVQTSTTVSSTWANTTLNDVATALTNSLAKDGQTTPTASLPMGGFRHTGVGNATARDQYPSVAQIQDGAVQTIGSVTGTDTITGSLSPAITAFAAGMYLRFEPAATNTGAVTIALNGLTAKAITKFGSTALEAGDLVIGVPAEITYDGTQFVLLNPKKLSASDLSSGTLPIARIDDGDVTYAKIQDVSATDRLLGRDAAGAGDVEELTVGGGVEFTGSGGIRRSALTGDVTASAGSNTTTIGNSAVSNAKLANMSASTIKGRASGAGTGAPTDLSASQVRSIINVENGATADQSAGEILTALETQTELSMSRFRATQTTDVNLSSTTHAFQTGPDSGTNIAMDGNEIQARNNGSASQLNLNAEGGTCSFGGAITASGDVTGNTSDERLKEGWEPLGNVVGQMADVLTGTFQFTQKAREVNPSLTDERRIGFSAQGIQRHWPEAVAPAPFDTDKDGNSKSGENYLTIRNEQLIPVIWQAVIDVRVELWKAVLDLKAEVDSIK